MEGRIPKASVIIVSYNTRGLLKRCIDAVRDSAVGLSHEIIVVDNGSRDGSAEYLRKEFADVILIESAENIGFAGANNAGYERASGEYIVMLNSDAFLVGDSLAASVALMDRHPEVGLAGGRLVGEDGAWQPSARSFPGLWNHFLTLTGLAGKYSKSRFFGRPDMTWIDQDRELLCDWVPGAFSIVRRPILERLGFFDERFFLYFEEVDLCRRIRKAGWKVAYWPSIRVIHLGGASTAGFSRKLVTKSGMQMSLWRLQSQYLYYRKNYGWGKAFASMAFESAFNFVRLRRNVAKDPDKAEESRVVLGSIRQAWAQTKGGKVSPPRPWKGV
jgi:GT2 family glycosyltransferase